MRKASKIPTAQTSKAVKPGKKVSSIKRHTAVDTQGLPHAIVITTADVTDRKGALKAIERCAANLQLVDGCYTGQPFAQAIKNKLGATMQVAQA